MSRITVDSLPDEARRLTQRWVENFERGKDRHEATRRKAERYYALYRSYRDFKQSYDDSSGRDVDSILGDAKHGFGTDLFIPYVFSVIETTLARMLSQNPTMKVRPAPTRQGLEALMKAEKNSENHRVLLEKQLSQTDYNLTVQDVGKSGLRYGLGIQKVRWVEKVVNGRKVLVPPTVREDGGPKWVQGTTNALIYDGPIAEWVDLFDWIHDPRGHDMNTVRWVIQRMWLDNAEVKARIEDGRWELPEGVELDDLLACGSSEARDELWSARMAAAGFPNADATRGEHLHEVWECWDGQESDVTTIMDRVCPVQHGGNPLWHGELPYSIFRPTRVEGEMLGIGEPESIEDLQEEMNVLRAQRRDNAAIVLQRPFVYFEGLVDADDFAWGAGAGLGVDGDPSNVINFPTVQDIPHSGYQEEMNLQRDIERTTGIDDTTSGGTGPQANTATEIQAVQAAAGVRIANKTKLLEQEAVKRACRQFLWLTQQKLDKTTWMPGPPKEDDAEGVARGWSAYEMGPQTLAGEFEPEPDAGSMGPPNAMEKIDRGTRLWNSFGQDPMVDPVAIREIVLECFGFENARSIIRVPEEQISQEELALATEHVATALGIDPSGLTQAMMKAVGEAKQLIEQEQEQGAAPGGEQQQGPPAAEAPA